MWLLLGLMIYTLLLLFGLSLGHASARADHRMGTPRGENFNPPWWS